MTVVRLRQPGGLDQLFVDRMAPARLPGPGEIRVRIKASSLNYHDFVVVTGGTSAADGHIPLSDAGGEVLAVGLGVDTLAVGDSVCSLFFPDWTRGRATPENTRRIHGDSCDGFAREEVTLPASAFTRAP